MKRPIVMAFGAFDGIHTGHIYYLLQAKKLGNTLIISVARDNSNWKFKRKYNLPEDERVELVRKLKIADEIMLGSQTDALEKVKEIKPDFIALTDYDPIDKDLLEKELGKFGLRTKIVVIELYKREIYDKIFEPAPTQDSKNLLGPSFSEDGKNHVKPRKELPFESIFKKEFGDITTNKILIVEALSEDVLKLNLAATQRLLDNGYNLVVVSTLRPYYSLLNLYKEANIDTTNITIIDFGSNILDVEQDGASHIIVSNISNLTSLSITLKETLNSPNSNTFILIDSISNLVLNNPVDSIA